MTAVSSPPDPPGVTPRGTAGASPLTRPPASDDLGTTSHLPQPPGSDDHSPAGPLSRPAVADDPLTLLPAAEEPSSRARPEEPPDPDAELVEAFRAGDVSAFERLYATHHRYVQLQARRVISDPHRAEDIAQEAFMRLVRQLLGSDGRIRLRAWLHRTTTNLAIDEHRRTRTMQQYHEQGSPVEELQAALERYDHGHPERMAEQSEIRATIVQVIAHLPPRYRRVLALRELDGLDYPSIAQAMGLSVSAVESLLFRARRRFTEVYQQLSDEPAPGQRRRTRAVKPVTI